ncbi:MAG: lysophospholipid acyltransferase family protein [Chloroflexota bacterium]
MTSETPIAGHVTLLIHLLALVARVLARSITRVRIEGDLDAIPREGAVLVAANHASNADPVVIGAFLTQALDRRVNWLGKKELFDVPVLGWLARNSGIHPVDRGAADLEAFKMARRILDAGHLLAVFPEGTRSSTGKLQPAKDGIALLALRTGAPIVPIGIVDADLVWPKGRRLPRPGGRITVRIGTPFHLETPDATVDRRAAKTLATDRIMRAIAELLPPRQRGVYGTDGPSG